jgi:hypothetical protein
MMEAMVLSYESKNPAKSADKIDAAIQRPQRACPTLVNRCSDSGLAT